MDMKNFIDPVTQRVYGYAADGSQDEFIPKNLQPITDAALAALRAPSPAQIKATLTNAMQAHLDAAAQALGYDSIATAVTYADEPAIAKYEAEGRALRAWRSQVWAAGVVVLDAVTAGTQQIPTAAALIASLPAFVPPPTT